MIVERKMTKWGLERYQDGMINKQIVPSSKNFSLPPDLKAFLVENERAWNNFQNFAPSSKLMYVHWINTAKTPETRHKRIILTVEQVAQNKKFGEP